MCTTATTSDVQNCFGRYLDKVVNGEEVIILKNGKEVARLVPRGQGSTFLVDSLPVILREAGAKV